MKIGVLGFQGGIYEHVNMLKRLFSEEKYSGEVLLVRRERELNKVDGIILPGGESTTIGIIMDKMGLTSELRDKIRDGLPVLGVCAGAVLMAKKVVDKIVGEKEQDTLSVMDIGVIRNYFGRQVESFEVDLHIPEIDEKAFRGVFIRAPVFEILNDNVEILAKLGKVNVAALQNSMIAVAFHPELTNDYRIHLLFLKMVKR
jgi:5'-phosphate synthase pdxT subunit